MAEWSWVTGCAVVILYSDVPPPPPLPLKADTAKRRVTRLQLPAARLVNAFNLELLEAQPRRRRPKFLVSARCEAVKLCLLDQRWQSS